DDLEDALGQLMLYRYLLRKKEPERLLYLAVNTGVYASFLSQPHVEPLLREENIRLIGFEPIKEEIIKLINWTDNGTELNRCWQRTYSIPTVTRICATGRFLIAARIIT